MATEMTHAEIEAWCPGYFRGKENPPPPDADTAQIAEVIVDYDVDAQESDGTWRRAGCAFPHRDLAENHASRFVGTHTPVPVHRQLIQVTRTCYVWDQPVKRCWVAEKRDVVAEYRYTGLPDPWAELERRYPSLLPPPPAPAPAGKAPWLARLWSTMRGN